MPHKICHVPLATPGQLFVMPRPPSGKVDTVIADLADRGVATLVCLLPDNEINELGLAHERDCCTQRSIAFVHFPIADFGLPEAEAFSQLAAKHAAELRDGRSIALHCRAGIGRTGTLACCILKELGHADDAAVDMVSKARGLRVPDTPEQRRFIADYCPSV